MPRPSTIFPVTSYNRAWIWLERIWQDLRHGWRVFAKTPGFTAIAVISIALGTGANVAVFGAADALILRPLPVPRPSELLTVGSQLHVGRWNPNAASYPDYLDIRDRNQSFEGLAAFTSGATAFSAHPGTPPQVKTATVVTWNFFRVLGIEPQIGRGFLPEEDQVVGRDAVTVLTYGVWQRNSAAIVPCSGARSASRRSISPSSAWRRNALPASSLPLSVMRCMCRWQCGRA